MLRIDGEPVGLSRDYTIYATNDQVTLVKDICHEKGVDTQSFRPRSLLSAISRLKNDDIPPDELTLDKAGMVLGLTLIMCAIAGLLAMRKVRSADPADVF